MARAPHNPIVIRPDTTIGNISAEADEEFLFNCFVDHPALAPLLDINSPKFFVSGRTGSGKTAILQKIHKANSNSHIIDLHDLALDYVSNSDMIRFLTTMDVDLDLFFQALWKHVLCIEFIRMKYNVNSKETSQGVFRTIFSFFSKDERRRAALDYLREWESKFWITMDENIREVTQRLERKIDAEFGGELEKFRARAGYASSLSSEKRAQLTARAKQVVNANLLTDLNRVIDLLSVHENGSRYSPEFYILIDRIDERWVDETIRYKLIRALIECLRSFRKIERLKIVVAIRSDVLERVVHETQDAGFQREKYDDYFLRLVWRRSQLKEMVDKRINYLYRRKYTKDNVFFEDVFRHKVGGKEAFDYILERTLHRPRDVISFVNTCLAKAQGESEVLPRHVKEAEAEYSRIRLQALVQEWSGAFPSLAIAFGLLTGRRERFTLEDVTTREFIDDFILRVDQEISSGNDPIVKAVSAYMKDGSPSRILSVARMLLAELYRIGAVGLKLAASERYFYSYKDSPVTNPDTIENSTKIHVHPMLHRALNTR